MVMGLSWHNVGQMSVVPYKMGPPVDRVQLVYKWLNSMV